MPRLAVSLAALGVLGLVVVTAPPAQESPTRPPETPPAGTSPRSTAPPAATPDQPSDRSDAPDSSLDPRTNPIRESTPTASSQGGPQAELQRGPFLRASSIIGVPVHGLGDARLGTVGDILIDPRTYELRYVLIDTGPGVRASGLPIIPWTLFQSSPAGPLNQRYLVVPLSIDRLAQAPATALGANDLAGNAPWIHDVDSFYVLDLSVRRVSRPELDVEAEARSHSAQGAATTPGANDSPATPRQRMQRRERPDREGAARNPSRSRTGTAGRVPGSVDPD